MKKNLEERRTPVMVMENLDGEIGLGEESRKTLHKITKYIRNFAFTECELESIRKELVGMAQEAEMRGTTLDDMIGNDVEAFSENLIEASLGHGSLKGRKILKVTGTMMLLQGAWFAFCTGLFLLVILIFGSRGAWEMTGGVVNVFYVLAVFAVYTALYFRAGLLGRRRSADLKAAKSCFYYGAAILVLRLLNEGIALWSGNAWDERYFWLNLALHIFIYGSLLGYLVGAWRNIRKKA